MFEKTTKSSNYEIGEYDDELWLKVFMHNHTTKENFQNESEALHCNSEYKYSILDEINPSMRIKHRYEFIMDFPHDHVFIGWEQSKNPVHELDGKPQADDFKMLDDNLPSKLAEFKGLTRSTIKSGNGMINCFFRFISLLECIK